MMGDRLSSKTNAAMIQEAAFCILSYSLPRKSFQQSNK